jgi:hypothetical protein
MPLIFLAPVVLLAVVAVLIAVIGVRSGRLVAKKGGAPGIDGGSGDSGMYH